MLERFFNKFDAHIKNNRNTLYKHLPDFYNVKIDDIFVTIRISPWLKVSYYNSNDKHILLHDIVYTNKQLKLLYKSLRKFYQIKEYAAG